MKKWFAALIGCAIILAGAQQGWASPPPEDTSTIGLDGDGGRRRADDPAPPPEVERILASRRVARLEALRSFSVTPQGVVAKSELSSASAVTPLSGDVPTFSSYMVTNWQRQQCSNWCGPASMRMALSHMSVVKTQSELAASVGTTCGGTGTYLGTMHSVLNGIGSGRGFAWDIQWLPYTPTSADKSAYSGRLYVSILGLTGSGRRYPLIGNMYMVSGGPNAPGYSGTKTYKHHVEINGFKDYGGTSQVQDPASGMSGFEAVPSKYHIESDKLVTILGARGYLY